MKSLLLSVFFSVTALASTNLLTVEDFRNDQAYANVYVQKAERVFVDELTGEDLYQVTYATSTSCEDLESDQGCDKAVITVCEYVWVDRALGEGKIFLDPTSFSCSEDLEDVLGEYLIDEL